MNMDTGTITDGVLAWARETVPELTGGYSYVPAAKDQALPDVVVELNGLETVVNDPRFPFEAIQQRIIFAHSIGLSFMVDNTDPEAAAETLRRWADVLSASLLAGGTLEGKVPFVSPLFRWDFTRPFVRYQDGTTGREATLAITVGDLVEVE